MGDQCPGLIEVLRTGAWSEGEVMVEVRGLGGGQIGPEGAAALRSLWRRPKSQEENSTSVRRRTATE